MNRRRLLARSSGAVTRQRVYRIPDGLEVDEIDHYEVHRWRVFFEDIVLVTYHRSREVALLAITGVLTAVFTLLAVGLGRQSAMAGWIVFGLTAAPLLVVFLVRLVSGVDEVNVYGRRTRARMRFALRKKRARRVFTDIVTQVRRRQAVLNAAAAATSDSGQQELPPLS